MYLAIICSFLFLHVVVIFVSRSEIAVKISERNLSRSVLTLNAKHQLEGTDSRSGSSLSLRQLTIPHRPNADMNAANQTQSPSHPGAKGVHRSQSASNPQKAGGRRFSTGGENNGQSQTSMCTFSSLDMTTCSARWDAYSHPGS